jgi:hypothetical protein
MKVNEVAGYGNHNTALFWEYDTRLGRRWNLDPKPTVGLSSFSAFSNNPILNTDKLGDSAWTTRVGDLVTIHLKGAVLALSDITKGGGGCSNEKNVENEYVKELNSTLNSLKLNQQDGISFRVEADFRLVKSMNEVSSSDHLVVISDKVNGNADPDLGGGRSGGVALFNGKIAYVGNSKNTTWLVQTTIHELGHNLGLEHVKTPGNFMSYDNWRTNFSPKQFNEVYRSIENKQLNQGANHGYLKGALRFWFGHTSTNDQPYKREHEKGEKIPLPVHNP